MSFNPDDIAAMLTEYKEEHPAIAMDIAAIAREIYAYAGGYPFLASWLCQIIDEKLRQDWSLNGVFSSAWTITRVCSHSAKRYKYWPDE
jgi:hypothetical protein